MLGNQLRRLTTQATLLAIGPSLSPLYRRLPGQTRGHNRVVTCAAAEWIASLYLEDGWPLGIRYNSRHGTD